LGFVGVKSGGGGGIQLFLGEENHIGITCV
jgi:hypothetical protein